MRIRSTDNGGIVEVDDSFGARLIADGGWEEATASKPTPTKTPTRRARRTAPEKEPETQE